MSPEAESKPWWQTLPGLLSAGAAIITAATGLLIALHQTGFFDRGHQAPAQSQSSSQPAGERAKPADAQTAASHPAATTPSPGSLKLPEMSQVRVGDAIIYKLVSARLELISPGKVSLRLTIRLMNNGRYDTIFGTSSFRLLVDGYLQAPTNNVSEVVASNSSRVDDIEFQVPANVSTVGLQMGDVGEGKGTIDLNLKNP